MILVQSCASYKKQVINTQRQISESRNRAWVRMLPEGTCVINAYGHGLELNRQDELNSCNIASVQMIVNTYGWHSFTEAQLQQAYREFYPVSGRVVDHMFHGQNPQVSRIAKFINDYIQWSWYAAVKDRKQLLAQDLLDLCSQGGSVMISIHSGLWYPHRVVVHNCYIDESWEYMVEFLNPSSTMTDKQWDHLSYRSKHIPRSEVILWDQPVVNTMNYEDLNFLHDKTLFTYSWPIDQIHPWYIIISKK